MKRKHPSNEVIKVEEGGIKHEIRKSSGGVKLGDLIWVKLHPSSWWPAQVVDADTVSELIKPSERSVGEVLVRVYGSYIYLYVDPLESRAEFDKILKLYNGNYGQILQESLDKDRPRSCKSEGPAASESSQSIEVGPEKISHVKSEEDNNTQEKEEDDLSVTRISDSVPQQKGRKLCSAKNNKSVKKNTIMLENGTSFQKRVSPRRKLSSKKLETNFENGKPKSEVSSATDAEKTRATKHKSQSQNTENEAARLDSKKTGKVDNIVNSPRQISKDAFGLRNAAQEIRMKKEMNILQRK